MLLLFANGKSSEWQRLALVCIFALVFFGFWAIITPNGYHADEVWNMAHVKYLEETGKIVLDHPSLQYFQFPGLHLTVSTISQISGLGIFETRILFLLFSGVLLTALLYLLFVRFLKSSYLSSLAVILMIQGSLMAKWQVFWPGNLAFLLLVALLMLLCAHEDDKALGTRTPWALIMIILLAAFTISYLPTPAYFVFILTGVYLLQKVAKKDVVRGSIISLFLVVFLAWEMFVAVRFFGGIVEYAPTFVAGFLNPLERFLSVEGAATGYVGESIPLWAGLTRYFWLALIFGFGGILGIRNLVRARKLGSIEVMETGGLLGVAVFSIVIYLAIPAAQWVRLMVFVPLFTVPIILRFLSGLSRHNELSRENRPPEDPEGSLDSNQFHKSFANFGRWFRAHVFTLLIILSFALSLPTFLIHETSFTTFAVYPQELSTGEFLESAYGSEEGLKLFSSMSAYTYTYYIPKARFDVINAPERLAGEEDLWLEINRLLYRFENTRDGNIIFVLSERFRRPANHPAAIETTDPRWVELVNTLEDHNKIYDNGHTKIYEHSDE